jgi:MarR family 2-MHQ and catechol resistance regulon transcriptional repressor
MEWSSMETEAHQPAIDAYVFLRRTHDAVTRQVDGELGKRGVSSVQYGVLFNLLDAGSLSLTELSERLFRSASNLTTLIDRMERRGLVRRVDYPEDRRVTRVELTPKGTKLAESVRPNHRHFLSTLMSCFSDDELAQLMTLLRKLRERAESPVSRGA